MENVVQVVVVLVLVLIAITLCTLAVARAVQIVEDAQAPDGTDRRREVG